MTRSTDLQRFLTASMDALTAATTGAARLAAGRIATQLAAAPGLAAGSVNAPLPVCNWVDPALKAGAAAGYHADLGRAFAALAGQLVWRRRLTADPADTAFWNGHANAMILGPSGLEERADVWVGVTVMAPSVTYVPHDHTPEEVYLPLAPGAWWNAGMEWAEPGPQGAIYNPPGILHSMRAGDGPFLALWYLPI